MTSTALSAQGSILQIATGTGGAKTITADDTNLYRVSQDFSVWSG